MDFSVFKPTAPSAAAVAEALERARAGQSEAAERVTSAKVARDDLLIDGSPAELAAAEAALVKAREDVDRAAAVVATLETRHVAAVRAEKIGKVEAAMKEAEAADADLQKWWVKNQAGLRRMMAEGHRLSVAATSSLQNLAFRRTLLLQDIPDAALTDFAGGAGDHREWRRIIAQLVDAGPIRALAPTAEPAAAEPPVRDNFGPGMLSLGVKRENDPGGSLAWGNGWQREARLPEVPARNASQEG